MKNEKHLNLKPQYILDDKGNKAFAVFSMAEYGELLTLLRDIIEEPRNDLLKSHVKRAYLAAHGKPIDWGLFLQGQRERLQGLAL